jgi:signal transduction histidine kinase
LSKINFLCEKLILSKELSSDSVTAANVIAETARDLVVNMREMIWVLHPANATIDGLLTWMREYSANYLEEFDLDVIFEFPDQMTNKQPLAPTIYKHVQSFVKESLNNIVKHAEASQVKLVVEISSSCMSVRISDDGKGFSPGVNEGNGLANMAFRIKEIGGEFEVSSSSGIGTELTFKIPLIS